MNAALSGRVAISALVVSTVALLASLAALLPGLLAGIETAFGALPSASALLGLFGTLLVLDCISFYLLAVRCPRKPSVEREE